jgi:hypothetical protein
LHAGQQLRLVTILLMSRNGSFVCPQQVAMVDFKGIELRVGTIDHATP